MPYTTLLDARELSCGLYSEQIQEFSLVLSFIANIQQLSLSCNSSQITVLITLSYKKNTTKQPTMIMTKEKLQVYLHCSLHQEA